MQCAHFMDYNYGVWWSLSPSPLFSVFTVGTSSLFKWCKNCQQGRKGKFSAQHLEDLPEETKIAEVMSPTQSQRDGWESNTKGQQKAAPDKRNESPFRAEANMGQRRVSRKILSILLVVYFLILRKKLWNVLLSAILQHSCFLYLKLRLAPTITPHTIAQENTTRRVVQIHPIYSLSIKNSIFWVLSYLWNHVEYTWIYIPCFKKSQLEQDREVDSRPSTGISNQYSLSKGSLCWVPQYAQNSNNTHLCRHFFIFKHLIYRW